MSDKIKVLHVGCGGISDSWFSVTCVDKRVEYVGICDINIDVAKEKKHKYNLNCPTFDDYKNGIKATNPDVVIDNTIPSVHYKIADYALEKGCSVFSEKPLSDDIDKALKIYKKSKEKNKFVFVMQNRRYLSNLWAIREVIDQDKIGNINNVIATFATEARFGGFREEMEFPLLMEMSVHTFDQARFITKANPVSVYCHAYNSKDSWYDGDASTSCIFEMDNGAVFTYNGTWTARGNLTSWESEWRIQGGKGAVFWDGTNGPWYEMKSHKEKDSMFPTEYDRTIIQDKEMYIEHKGCINNMIESYIKGEKAMTDISDNILSLAMVVGSIESAKLGKKIYIKDLIG